MTLSSSMPSGSRSNDSGMESVNAHPPWCRKDTESLESATLSLNDSPLRGRLWGCHAWHPQQYSINNRGVMESATQEWNCVATKAICC